MSDGWEPPLPGAPREPAGPALPDEDLGAGAPDAPERARREADLRRTRRYLLRVARVLFGAIVIALLAGLAWRLLRADG